MILGFQWQWGLDGWIVVAGVLCAVSAALLGNFLVLRRLSLLGDAISHAVLPGLAVAFLISESRSSWPMFLGAVVVGLLTAMFTQWIRNAGNVDEGASMGVVFTTLFALGLLLIVQVADRVDLDPGCVLYGAIEFTPIKKSNVLGWHLPTVVVTLATILAINIGFVVLFFKELRISAFDPALSTTLGISANVMHYLLMVMVAVTAVASFESVGNVLVVAMFIVPPAAALMFTNRLVAMVWLSAVIAAASAVAGHLMAITVPTWFGFAATSTAGMMAVAVGLIFVVAVAIGPKQGILPRWLRQRQLKWRILWEDVIALLYRIEEKRSSPWCTMHDITTQLGESRGWIRRVLRRQLALMLIESQADSYRLTAAGRKNARELVRSHRLWEQYLAAETDVPVDRLHQHAERLEHFTGRALRERLDSQVASAKTDPHGSPIPPEDDDE